MQTTAASDRPAPPSTALHRPTLPCTLPFTLPFPTPCASARHTRTSASSRTTNGVTSRSSSEAQAPRWHHAHAMRTPCTRHAHVTHMHRRHDDAHAQSAAEHRCGVRVAGPAVVCRRPWISVALHPRRAWRGGQRGGRRRGRRGRLQHVGTHHAALDRLRSRVITPLRPRRRQRSPLAPVHRRPGAQPRRTRGHWLRYTRPPQLYLSLRPRWRACAFNL